VDKDNWEEVISIPFELNNDEKSVINFDQDLLIYFDEEKIRYSL
jgi:hypothetical protein